MIANGCHVLTDVGAEFANLVIFRRRAEMFGLKMCIHCNVSLEALLAHRALEAELRFEFLFTGRGRHFGYGLTNDLFGGRDALMAKLHEKVCVHVLLCAAAASTAATAPPARPHRP